MQGQIKQRSPRAALTREVNFISQVASANVRNGEPGHLQLQSVTIRGIKSALLKLKYFKL